MKTNILIIVLVLVGSVCFAQIKPYNENGYQIEAVKAFSVEGSTLASNWRREILSMVNAAMAATGERVVYNGQTYTQLDERWMHWILARVSYEIRDIVSCQNSKKLPGDIIKFFPDSYNGMVAVFRFGKIELILYKTICLNLLKDCVLRNPNQQITQTAPPPASNGYNANPQGYSQPAPVNITINNNIYNTQPTAQQNSTPTTYRAPEGRQYDDRPTSTTIYEAPKGRIIDISSPMGGRYVCTNDNYSCGSRGGNFWANFLGSAIGSFAGEILDNDHYYGGNVYYGGGSNYDPRHHGGGCYQAPVIVNDYGGPVTNDGHTATYNGPSTQSGHNK